MRYKEGDGLNFENAIPSSGPVEGQYFEFEIIGKNTNLERDIIYDIVINHGDDHQTRQTRLDDKFLKFRLVEVEEENYVKTEVAEPLVNNKSYASIENKRIYVATIPKNTQNEIRKIYRLYAWIDNSIKIGNTSGVDYQTSVWNTDVFASIKVNVTGDFTGKEIQEVLYDIVKTGAINDSNIDGDGSVTNPYIAATPLS